MTDQTKDSLDRDPPRRQDRWLTRKKVAWTILAATTTAVALGLIWTTYQRWAYDYWQARLVHGQSVIVRFICGTDLVSDCHDQFKITYERRGDLWCETLWRNAESYSVRANWCNANPELGTISLYGAPHSFNRFGVVTRAGHLVGQMFLQ
jgi:hypothetical protein